MSTITKTAQRALVIDGLWRLPLGICQFENFRAWRLSDQFPEDCKATFTGDVIFLETPDSLRWGDRSDRPHGVDENMPGFLIDDWLQVPFEAFTFDGFRAWAHSAGFPTTIKATYADGSIEIDMSPEEQESHGKLKVQIVGRLGAIIEKEQLGDLLVERTMLTCAKADLSTEPDILFCSWQSYRTGRVVPREWKEHSGRYVEIAGAPDLVIELISNSSEAKDKRTLKRKYWKAGIPEYWLIDARGEAIDFQIFRRGKRGYQAVEPDPQGYRRSAVLNRSFRITRRLNPVGRYAYRLLHR